MVIEMPIGTSIWDVETNRIKLEKNLAKYVLLTEVLQIQLIVVMLLFSPFCSSNHELYVIDKIIQLLNAPFGIGLKLHIIN